MIKLIDILREEETIHAKQRYATRFEKQPQMTREERDELFRRYDALKTMASQFEMATVLLLSFDRIIYFHPDMGKNVPLETRESNGETVWAVIREGKIKTIFARRKDQRFDYWEDITRGNVTKENIWYMKDILALKKLKYEPHETVGTVIARKTDFAHNYKKPESETKPKQDGSSAPEVVKEDPDVVTDAQNVEIASFYDTTAVTFAYYNGDFKVLHNDQHPNGDSDAYIHADLFTGEAGQRINRWYLKFSGRAWKRRKIISFWGTLPNAQEMNKLLNDLKTKGNLNIDPDSWEIELPQDFRRDHDLGTLRITISDYIKIVGSDAGDYEFDPKQHLLPPTKKKPRPNPGFGSKHPQYIPTMQMQHRQPAREATEPSLSLIDILYEIMSGGATMNLQDMDKHNKKLKKLRKIMATQGDEMMPYPDLEKTVVGVPWKQLLKKYPMPKSKRS